MASNKKSLKEKEYLSLYEITEYLDVSKQTIERLIRKGQLKAYTFSPQGNKRFFKTEDVFGLFCPCNPVK